ncbi:telomere binding protein [Orbilia oligospora]|uniref:Telomere binding protein n=1 Tax=Orbilia oligospora TaxID=2813651 RepID=A0A7C8NR12_ORBOL|nr:telomere binding protein [Orbilia oligospora]
MDGLLTPIRITSLKTSNPEGEAIDLKLSSTTLIRPVEELPSSTATTSSTSKSNTNRKPTSPEDALEILRSQPSLSELSTTLSYLLSQPQVTTDTPQNESTSSSPTFDVTSISPLTSRIVNVLIVDTIPSFWGLLTSSTSSHKADRNKLLQCLRSIVGLGGVIERLRLLLKQVPTAGRPKNVTVTKIDVESIGKKEGVVAQIRDLMDVLGLVLRGNGVLGTFWKRLKFTSGSGNADDRKKEMAWKEFVGLVAGGKVLSVAAEADIAISEADEAVEKRRYSWIGEGKQYMAWLRDNILNMVDGTDINNTDAWKATASILARGFGLGYTESLIDTRLCLNPSTLTKDIFTRTRTLLSHLKEHERGIYINTLLKLLSQNHLPIHLEDSENYTKRVSLAAKIIEELCILNDGLQNGYQDILLEWILVNGGPGSGEPIGIRRAIICALKASTEAPTIFQEALESQVQTFGENLWIRHAPIIHQEVNVQCLLLCVGYVHSQPPSYLKIIARSSSFMNGVSNHLASTNTRVRFLGMIVGETISTLVDKSERQLKFKDSLDASDEEAAKWRALVNIDDIMPNFDIFKDKAFEDSPPRKPSKKLASSTKKPDIVEISSSSTPGTTSISNIPSTRIQELDSSSDDDFIPYPKPDSDPDDSDDDATLVNRKKVPPPVYIRDLLYLLTDHDSFDKQKVALLHAAVLIRRKATYGTEVSAHAVDLLTALVGMQDKFSMEDFDNLRLKAVVSLLVTLPLISGPWTSQRIFGGDYSLAERCVMLSGIGIAAMELSGEEIPEDSPLYHLQLSTSEKEKTQFPSKKLPKRLHDTYAPLDTAIDTISTRLKDSILQPIAAKAADELSTAPSLIKIRKFSTRMEVEANRKKPGVNKLSQVVIPAFFGPLTGRWWVFVKDHGGASSDRLIPHLLGLYIKTLTVLLHATGPNGLMVPQMVDGFWDILLSLRHAKITLENSTVLDAVLIGLLTIFEVCKEDRDRKRLAEERSKELVETQEWVSKVFEGSDGSEGNGEERKGLAAAVLLRCREVVERYERILMGDLIG